jgi:hypothetical protein
MPLAVWSQTTRAGSLAVMESSPWAAGRPWSLVEAEAERRARAAGGLVRFEVVIEPAEFDVASQ